MMRFCVLLLSIGFSLKTSAFVSGPGSLSANDSYLVIGSLAERGKIEPNENKSSFQDAQIDAYKINFQKGFGKLYDVNDSTLSIEFGQFNSAKEQVGSTLFYEQDKGSYVTIGFAGSFIHVPEKRIGFYLQFTPSRSYNKNKFSNPRLDTFAFGFTSEVAITEKLFQRQLIHYGSGDGKNQNSYIALDTGVGYKLDAIIDRQLTVLASLFLEADTSERFDASYDAAFSAAGTSDRIRSFKYGTLLGFNVELTKNTNLNVNYLQKLGGYDARSTQILAAGIGYKF